MAKAKISAPAADPFAKFDTVSSKAKVVAKKGELPIIVLTDLADESALLDLILLGTLNKGLSDLYDVEKTEIGKRLFEEWVEEMWADKSVPTNSRYMVRKRDAGGQPTTTNDASVIFQVQFRSDGLKKSLPDAEALEKENLTAEDFLCKELTTIGLSEKHAIALIKAGDIFVQRERNLVASLNELYYSDDAAKRSGGRKLMSYLLSDGSDKAPVLTQAEREACLQTTTTVVVKDGFFERAYTYCRTMEELLALLNFVKVKLVFTSLNFGISDKPREKTERLEAGVRKHLMVLGS